MLAAIADGVLTRHYLKLIAGECSEKGEIWTFLNL
jgi:hypothetical protein